MSTPNLETRNPNENIAFTGNTPQGGNIPQGCNVTLKCGDVGIIACVDSCEGTNYTGVVQGFENWSKPEWKGWSNGTQINFCEPNVYCCDTTAVAA